MSSKNQKRDHQSVRTWRIERDSVGTIQFCTSGISIAAVTSSPSTGDGGDDSRWDRHLADTVIESVRNINITCKNVRKRNEKVKYRLICNVRSTWRVERDSNWIIQCRRRGSTVITTVTTTGATARYCSDDSRWYRHQADAVITIISDVHVACNWYKYYSIIRKTG